MLQRTLAASTPLLLAGAFTACAADGPSHRGALIADSAGVRVVVNPAPQASALPVWRLVDRPAVEIGALDGPPEYQLYQVMSGTVLDDGTIVVANGGSLEIRAYDAAGRHLWSAGRGGDGPGEFRSLTALWEFGGDSILAWDFQAGRASVFSAAGAFVRSFMPGSGSRALPFMEGVLRDGTIIVRYLAPRRDDRPGAIRRQLELRLERGDGSPSMSLGEYPGSEVLVLELPGGRPAVTDVVFGREFHLAAAGDRFALATSDAYSVRIHDTAGELLHLVRLDREPRPIRDEDFQAYFDRGLKSEIPVIRELTQAQFRQSPRHATFPAFASIRLDRVGRLWVEEYRPPGVETVEWLVFDADGVLAARVEMPRRFWIAEIGADYVLGVQRDELGVETVRLYRLVTDGPYAVDARRPVQLLQDGGDRGRSRRAVRPVSSMAYALPVTPPITGSTTPVM